MLPPLPAALVLAAGIALAPHAHLGALGPWLFALGCAASARRSRGWAIAAVVAVGLARGAAGGGELPPGVIANDRELDRIVGVVDGPVVTTARGTGAEVDGVFVWSQERLAAGERVAVSGRVIRDGDAVSMSAQTVEHLGEGEGLRPALWRWAEQTQRAAGERIERAGGDRAASAALRGIAIGDRSGVPAELDQRWRAAGIYHVLSVSGLHLAVIAGLAFALLTMLVAASPWGGRIQPARWAAPPALALAIAYTLVTGAQIATVRALIVVALWMTATTLARPIRLLDALGAAAIVLLVWRPQDLWDPAFQLSFIAALTLALIPPARDPLGAEQTRRRRIARWIVRGVTTSLWVAITTAPITALHFQQVSAGGVIGNLVLTPIVELVALPLALAGLVLGALGEPLIRVAAALVELVDGGAGVLAQVMPVGRVAVASTLVMGLLVALSLWLATRGGRRSRTDLALWLVLCVVWGVARSPPSPGVLRVTFLDVGQGDAAIVELPDGHVWVIDTGPRGGPAITRALVSAGQDEIDLAIISHPHPDHYGGLAELGVPVHELWTVRELEPTRDGLAFAEIAGRVAAPTLSPPLGIARVEAGVTLEVLAPRYAGLAAADPVRSVNDNSLVLALEYRGRRILFAGDVEHEGEEALVANGLASVDVVKVPHHGSPTSSSPAFVAATAPRLAVISCGRGNRFGFPSPAVVARWRAAGARLARTDEGSVTVVIDAGGGLAVP